LPGTWGGGTRSRPSPTSSSRATGATRGRPTSSWRTAPRCTCSTRRGAKGSATTSRAPAYKADPASEEAKLKVKFYVPPFLPIIPVVGDYWVLYVDDDCQYALVGEPRRKSLWILCRKTHIEEEVYNQLLEKDKEEGYDVAKLHKTPQSDPPPESDAAPTDSKGTWWFKSLFGK